MAMKALFVLTSTKTLGRTDEQTGVWLEELAIPYSLFRSAGVTVSIASPLGGRAPIDPRSVRAKGENDSAVDQFLADQEAMGLLNTTTALSSLGGADYEAIFLPGGHGASWDLPTCAPLADLLRHTWAAGRVIAAVCHGVAGLVGATDVNGHPIVFGRHVTGFTDSEERAVGMQDRVPFLLETRLRELGGLFASKDDFQPFALDDDGLVTGQNPASSRITAELTLKHLIS
jgi:putative intracellular protease/amidase